MNNIDQLKSNIEAYAQNNPIEIYGDYNDKLPNSVIEAILSGDQDKAYEAMSEIEDRMYLDDNYSRGYAFDKYAKDNNLQDLPEDTLETLKDIFLDNCSFDYSDLWRHCINNTRVNITVTLLDDAGNPIPALHPNINSEKYEALKAQYAAYFGDDGTNLQSIYESEVLKVCGTADLQEILKNGLPKKIRISPRDKDNILSHCSWNGAGNMGSITPTKEHIFNCIMRNDDTNKYGVQAVWGFTGQFWQHDLDFIWE